MRIASLYFYTLSLVGFVLLLIGIFASIHYIVGVTQYSQYPLGYSTATRCLPMAEPVPTGTVVPKKSAPNMAYLECMKGIEQDREALQTADLEKAFSFTLIGLLVFGLHFYLARKQKN